MLGNDQKAGCVTIQTVDGPEGEALSLLGKIPGDSIGQSIVKVSLGGVDRHTGRFVNHHQILVLIENGKFLLHRHDVSGWGIVGNTDGEKISFR